MITQRDLDDLAYNVKAKFERTYIRFPNHDVGHYDKADLVADLERFLLKRGVDVERKYSKIGESTKEADNG